ncbi:MAG: hypothetical protein U1E82_03230 [Nitrosomonas sp.]|nr:hypothetical protein [Nitrosomonas sp.]
MIPTSLDKISLRPRDHRSALWWLGLIYRSPESFRKEIARLRWSRALLSACFLYLHFLPYYFIITTLGFVFAEAAVVGLNLFWFTVSWLEEFVNYFSLQGGHVEVMLPLLLSVFLIFSAFLVFGFFQVPAFAIKAIATRINRCTGFILAVTVMMIVALGIAVVAAALTGLDLNRPEHLDLWESIIIALNYANLAGVWLVVFFSIYLGALIATTFAIEAVVTGIIKFNRWILGCAIAVITFILVNSGWDVFLPAIGIVTGIWICGAFFRAIIRWIPLGITEGIWTMITFGLLPAFLMPLASLNKELLTWWLHMIALGIPIAIIFGITRHRWIGLIGGLLLPTWLLTQGNRLIWPYSEIPLPMNIELYIFFFVILSGITLFRMYYWPYHLLFVWPALKPQWYRWHPVAWDDLCTLPFPSLDRLLAAYAEIEPAKGEQEINRLIETYPNQRMAALCARARLIARTTGQEPHLSRLDSLVAKLPEGDKHFLRWTAKLKSAVSEIAELQRRIDNQDRPFLREPTALALCKTIENFQGQIAGYPEPLRSEFGKAFSQWLSVAKAQYYQVRTVLEREPRPQVFRAGDPVDRNKEAFIPREGVLGDLDRQLTLASGCPGVIIYGRRRMGKSTLLRNLDGFLPASTRVTVLSMQNPDVFSSQDELLTQLSHSCLAVWPENQRSAPTKTLPDFFKLLTKCNDYLESKSCRLILAIDEYENLDRKLGEGIFHEDLLAAMRESIQYHRSLIWFFAGSHSIEELNHAPWASYLISARTVEIPPFSEAETRRLLTEPLRYSLLWEKDDPKRPRLTADFWGEGGIEYIHHVAAGWPHLVQLLAETTVDLCNDREQDIIDATLLDQAIAKAVVTGDTVLRQLLCNEASDAEWAYLSGFRRLDTQPIPNDEAVYRGIRRRLLITDVGNGEWRLRVPLMQRWLRERG